jgi:hypothetical protein
MESFYSDNTSVNPCRRIGETSTKNPAIHGEGQWLMFLGINSVIGKNGGSAFSPGPQCWVRVIERVQDLISGRSSPRTLAHADR